ncbi:hypothetical protein V2G26_019726 [Clonostachys chloroleuca]
MKVKAYIGFSEDINLMHTTDALARVQVQSYHFLSVYIMRPDKNNQRRYNAKVSAPYIGSYSYNYPL